MTEDVIARKQTKSQKWLILVWAHMLPLGLLNAFKHLNNKCLGLYELQDDISVETIEFIRDVLQAGSNFAGNCQGILHYLWSSFVLEIDFTVVLKRHYVLFLP